MELYTLKDLFRDFGRPEQCLEFLAGLRWPDGIYCDKCGDITRHHFIMSRKASVCQHCKRKTSPTAGTIFHATKVPLPVVPDTKRDTVMPIFERTVEKGVEVHSDEYNIYNCLEEKGYKHDTVKHGARQYVKYREDGTTVHTNGVEGFWSYPKNAIKGVHRGVSDHKLQGYVNEYTYRYSHRGDDEPMFFSILRRVVQAGPSSLAA